MKSTFNDDQKDEKEKKKRDTVTDSAGRFKSVYDKTNNVKSKYNEAKSIYGNINSARKKTQNGYRWLKNGKVHPTSQTATQQLSMQTAANMLPQITTILGA